MKYTEKDLKLFESFRKSNIGKNLLDFLERLQVDMRDCANWDKVDEENAKAAIIASSAIEKHLIQKIKYTQSKKRISEFE